MSGPLVIKIGGSTLGEADSTFADVAAIAAGGDIPIVAHGGGAEATRWLEAMGIPSRFENGLRVTDDAALACAKEANGRLRIEIEALLSMGLPTSPMAGADIRVASGNFITAKPLGVRDGVDFMHTGEVRRVDAQAIQRRLEDNELVLLSPLGYSPTGEVFNLVLEDVAASTAIALKAEKLIFLMDTAGVTGRRGELLRAVYAAFTEGLDTADLKDAAALLQELHH